MYAHELLRDAVKRACPADGAPRTVDMYNNVLRILSGTAAGWLPVDDPSMPQAMQRLLSGLLACGHGRTAEQVYVLVNKAAPMAVDGVPRPRFHRLEPSPLDDEDAQKVLHSAEDDEQLWLALALAMACGLRRGEICGLRWDDVDMIHNQIHIQNQRQRVKGKGLVDMPPKSEAGYRIIPIPQMLTDALAGLALVNQAEALLGGVPCPYVLSGARGKGEDPNRLDRRCQAHLRACGVHAHLHDLRHTMATIAVCNGVPMRVVQMLLGHASYTTTAKYYAHSSREAERSAVQILQKHLTLNQGVPGSSP